VIVVLFGRAILMRVIGYGRYVASVDGIMVMTCRRRC